VGFLGSVYFIGYLLTLLWVPRYADRIGRKVMFTWGMVVMVILYTVLMFTRHFYVMLFTIFLFGCMASVRQIIGWVYFMELLPKQNQTSSAVIFTIIDGTTYLLVTIYFWLISKQWVYIISFGYLL